MQERCPISTKAKFVLRFVESKTKEEQKQILREQLNHVLDCDHPHCKKILNGMTESVKKGKWLN